MNLKHIYKILNKEDLKKAKSNGAYSGSSKDIEDGYIHFSSQEQVEGTLKKYYSDEKNLILLKAIHSLLFLVYFKIFKILNIF